MTMRSRLSTALPHGALLYPALVLGALKDVLHEDARRVHGVGGNLSWIDEALDLRNGASGGRGHHRIEVARGFPVNEIAKTVPTVRAHEREVCLERQLEHIRPAVDDARLLTLGNNRVVAGG